MLKMECPKCKGWIHSKILRESNDVFCENCNEDVKVDNVYVSASGYTILKDILNDRVYRYEKLLKEAEKELEVIAEKTSHKGDESVKSINNLVVALKELLEGARNTSRVQLPNVSAEYEFENHKKRGEIIDLSVTGSCIEIDERGQLPQVKREINLKFSLPDSNKKLSIKGKVVWIKRGVRDRGSKTAIGIKFEELSDEVRTLIWDFITTKNMEDQIACQK
jgi:hypothetical protein